MHVLYVKEQRMIFWQKHEVFHKNNLSNIVFRNVSFDNLETS